MSNNITNICVNCGDEATEKHFIIPLNKGGNNFSTNMVWLCSTCKDKLEQIEDEHIKEKRKCINCGKQADNKHHVVPRSLGGNNSTNCVWLCDDCHSLVHGITVNNGTLSHSDLIKIGIQKARESGKEIGRPNVAAEDLEWFKPYYQEILNGKPIAVLAREINKSRPTIYKYINILKKEFDKNEIL